MAFTLDDLPDRLRRAAPQGARDVPRRARDAGGHRRAPRGAGARPRWRAARVERPGPLRRPLPHRAAPDLDRSLALAPPAPPGRGGARRRGARARRAGARTPRRSSGRCGSWRRSPADEAVKQRAKIVEVVECRHLLGMTVPEVAEVVGRVAVQREGVARLLPVLGPRPDRAGAGRHRGRDRAARRGRLAPPRARGSPGSPAASASTQERPADVAGRDGAERGGACSPTCASSTRGWSAARRGRGGQAVTMGVDEIWLEVVSLRGEARERRLGELCAGRRRARRPRPGAPPVRRGVARGAAGAALPARPVRAAGADLERRARRRLPRDARGHRRAGGAQGAAAAARDRRAGGGGPARGQLGAADPERARGRRPRRGPDPRRPRPSSRWRSARIPIRRTPAPSGWGRRCATRRSGRGARGCPCWRRRGWWRPRAAGRRRRTGPGSSTATSSRRTSW